ETTSASTLKDGKMKITATIDGKIKTITEAYIRRHLKLEDSDGISSLPNTGIFEQLALIGGGSRKKIVAKKRISAKFDEESSKRQKLKDVTEEEAIAELEVAKMELHENYGVHTLFMDGELMEINMLVEKKYPLIKELLEKIMILQFEAEEESTMAFKLIKFIKSLFDE
nr:hypothetical protein [Tanacetum cinerariifolium]